MTDTIIILIYEYLVYKNHFSMERRAASNDPFAITNDRQKKRIYIALFTTRRFLLELAQF